MSAELELHRIETVLDDARVCHYDELGSPAKERLPILINHEPPSVEEAVIQEFNACDIVKFTDYYEIVVH